VREGDALPHRTRLVQKDIGSPCEGQITIKKDGGRTDEQAADSTGRSSRDLALRESRCRTPDRLHWDERGAELGLSECCPRKNRTSRTQRSLSRGLEPQEGPHSGDGQAKSSNSSAFGHTHQIRNKIVSAR